MVVNQSIKKYLRNVDPDDPHILSEQYALETIDRPEDVEHYNEFTRIFRLEFRSQIPRIQLAKRLGEPISKYVKFDDDRSWVPGI